MNTTLHTYNLTMHNDEDMNKNKLDEYKREEQHHLKFNEFTNFINKGDTCFMFDFRTTVLIPHQTSYTFHTFCSFTSRVYL